LMVLSPIHFVPSVVAAILALIINVKGRGASHLTLAYVMIGSALLGLFGFAISDLSSLTLLNFHTIHAFVGVIALISSLVPMFRGKLSENVHCLVGRTAAVFSLISLVMGLMILTGLVPVISRSTNGTTQIPVVNALPEVEALQFQGVLLTPIAQQGNNAIKGTQVINRASYRLEVTGLVERNITLTYSDLLAYPAFSTVAYLPCVDGWGFYAKWTGFRVSDILESAGVAEGGDYVVFYCADGYSTGLPLTYLDDRHILLAYGLNDVTLPVDRGFPLQLVSESKYGYKWAKWIVKVEVVNSEVKGYWESRGYSNTADSGSFPFG
jgi:DMSO/TMAO reductase YedYZ molybdopterin-dependent catalytic subunit